MNPPKVTLRPSTLRRPAPDPSPEEAAAIVGALGRFMCDTTPPPSPRAPGQSAWQRAALREGVSLAPEPGIEWA